MLNLQIQDQDIARLGLHLRLLDHITQDQRFLSETGMHLASQAKRNINESTPDGSTSYKLLMPSTIRQRRHTYPNRNAYKPLIASGALRLSLSHEVATDGLSLTSTFYGKFHQEGTKNMEARPFFSIRSQNYNTILSFIQNFLKRTWLGLGRYWMPDVFLSRVMLVFLFI